MQKRILVLGNWLDRSVYRPVEEWSRHFGDVPFDAVHIPSHEPIPPLDRYTHVLLTGSDASFAKPEPWFDVEAEVTRDAVDRGLSILGSCFGHQMLAWALSGHEYVRRAPIPELGWVAVDIVAPDPLFADLPNPWHTFAAHLDEVVDPPEPWRILASNDVCAVQAMRYGDRPVGGGSSRTLRPLPTRPGSRWRPGSSSTLSMLRRSDGPWHRPFATIAAPHS